MGLFGSESRLCSTRDPAIRRPGHPNWSLITKGNSPPFHSPATRSRPAAKSVGLVRSACPALFGETSEVRTTGGQRGHRCGRHLRLIFRPPRTALRSDGDVARRAAAAAAAAAPALLRPPDASGSSVGGGPGTGAGRHAQVAAGGRGRAPGSAHAHWLSAQRGAHDHQWQVAADHT